MENGANVWIALMYLTQSIHGRGIMQIMVIGYICLSNQRKRTVTNIYMFIVLS